MGQYDPKYPLIIDPTLIYKYDIANATRSSYGIAVDQASSIYTSGYYDDGGFVSRINANGTSHAWLTTIGLDYNWSVSDVAFNSVYGLYAIGYHDTGSFLMQLDPVTGSILMNVSLPQYSDTTELQIGSDGSLYFIAEGQLVKANSAGTIQFSLSVAGVYLAGVSINSNNQIAITGTDNNTIYAATISPQGAVLASTLFGGSNVDDATSVAIDTAGFVYVTGATKSADFPLVNPTQATLTSSQACWQGCPDVFVTKLNPSLQTIVFSTFLGGSGGERSRSIAVEGNQIAVGGVALIDDVSPTPLPFPLVQAVGLNDGILRDSFITKYEDQGQNNIYNIRYSTHLGDANQDEVWDLEMHQGNVYIAGESTDQWEYFSAYVARIDDAPPIVPGGDVVNINFQPYNSSVPLGYLPDSGQLYDNQGNNWSYGWLFATPSLFTYDSDIVVDQRYDTEVTSRTPAVYEPATELARWEIAIPNGRYKVRLVTGTPRDFLYYNWVQAYIEGVPAIATERDSTTQKWIEATVEREVHDQKLTITVDSRSTLMWSLAFLEISHANQPNQAPIVIMTDLENTAFKGNQPITLHADAYDPDGYITEVKFFANSIYLGSDTIAPYSYNWGCPNYDIPCMASIPADTYSISANAVDDSGATTGASPVTIGVDMPMPIHKRKFFDVELKIFIPYQWAEIPLHPFYLIEVAKGDDRDWSSTAHRYRVAQTVTMIPKTGNDTDGTVDGVQAGSFHNWVNTSVNYDEASSVNPDTLRLNRAAKIEPLDEAHKGFPYMVNYGVIPTSTLNLDMHMTPLPITSPYNKSVQLHGEASDPIIHPNFATCDIDWNLTVEIDQSVSPPRARVFGDHDDFPAHELYIDGQPIYQWKPPTSNSVLNLCPFPPYRDRVDVNTNWITIR